MGGFMLEKQWYYFKVIKKRIAWKSSYSLLFCVFNH